MRAGLAESRGGHRARPGLRDCPGCRGRSGRVCLSHHGRASAAPRGVCDCWRLPPGRWIPCRYQLPQAPWATPGA
eukprot:8208142-Alexandrium_andersonii.AAC.1